MLYRYISACEQIFFAPDRTVPAEQHCTHPCWVNVERSPCADIKNNRNTHSTWEQNCQCSKYGFRNQICGPSLEKKPWEDSFWQDRQIDRAHVLHVTSLEPSFVTGECGSQQSRDERGVRCTVRR